MEFKHPKYYKELRKRNKLDQAISDEASTEATSVRPGPGPKQQAVDLKINLERVRKQYTSSKQQASSTKLLKPQAASVKPQAQRLKLQATSFKRQDS